jgi:hypothetical protein
MKRPSLSRRRLPAFLNPGSAPRSRRLFARCVDVRLLRSVCIVTMGFSCLTAFSAKKVDEPGVKPIQAELMADLNARLMQIGSPVYARVTVDWTGNGCVLRKGAVVEAHVVSVAPFSRSTKLSELDLAFTQAQCDAPKMAALALLLAALAAPPRESDLGMLTDPMPMSGASLNGPQAIANLRAMQLSANPDLKLGIESSSYEYQALPRMHVGDVSGIHGLKLSVGSGSGNSTVLASKGHDVALEKHTILLLIPAEGTYPHSDSEAAPASAFAPAVVTAAASEPAIAPLAVRPANVESPDDIDLCDPTHCNVALTAGDETDGGKPEISFSVHQLGYASRPQKEMRDFDQDEAVAWLGQEQLLVAFNPHELITRHSLGPSGSTARIIRAALLDTRARKVIRTVDWELPDDAQYLWPLEEGRILVHVGSELRVYGAGLKVGQRIPLQGPLAFVRITPDGNFLVVGQVRERHSPELHAQLKESLQGEPEEDVSVTVLNRQFETIAQSDARSDLLPPTLLNEGQARLQALPNRRYRVGLVTWNSQSSVLANFGSRCTPRLSSLAPDLLFLASCNPYNGLLEYRVLTSSGKLTLKGFSTSDDLVHTAMGIGNPGTFVVRTIRSSAVSFGNPFTASSLDSEELGVYRAADGRRLFGVRVGSPSASRDGYALAADGSKLAVLTRDQISVYPVTQ